MTLPATKFNKISKMEDGSTKLFKLYEIAFHISHYSPLFDQVKSEIDRLNSLGYSLADNIPDRYKRTL